MGKNDFDTDFDFEEEYGFDPKAFLGTEEYDEDIDLSEFSDEELGLTPPSSKETEEDAAAPDFDLDEDLDLDEFLNLGSEEEPEEEEEEAEEDYELSETEDFSDEELTEEPEESEEEEESEFSDEEEWDTQPDFPEDTDPEETDMNEPNEYSEEELLEEPSFEDEPVYEEEDDGEEPARKAPRQRKRKEKKEIKLPKINLPKLSTPNIFTKFYDLYFGPVLDKSKREEPVDPNNPRRRRRKSRVQIFKEVYLPPIIACVCLVLVLSFTIGSISNAIEQHRIDKSTEQSRLDESQSAEAVAEEQRLQVMAEAEELAACYDYDAAITKLDSFGDLSKYPDMSSKRSEYVSAKGQLVEYKTPSLIPNLSFHVLIEDLARAMADEDGLAGSYNKNFVSTAEFKAILSGLYNNGYVLVDFNSFVSELSDPSGNKLYEAQTVYLPADKKPVMITETLVNYLSYMIDSDNDGVADAGGDGFASKLVVQNGKIKAEYVNASGETLIGDYDLVPILESFIEEHPDFSYRGARATVAMTGDEGVFGYRTNTAYTATKGNDYYEQEVAGAKEVAQALRNKGYTLACYTYGNIAYGDKSAAQITADLQSWAQQITPVIGDVSVLVFARNSNISDYSGNLFNVLYTSGFRYFVSNGTQPWGEINTTYVRQNRLLVTGETMAWYPERFTGMFDCAAILDVNTRGSVPKS